MMNKYKAWTIIACLNPSVRQCREEKKNRMNDDNEIKFWRSTRMHKQRFWPRLEMTILDWIFNKISNIHEQFKPLNFSVCSCCCYSFFCFKPFMPFTVDLHGLFYEFHSTSSCQLLLLLLSYGVPFVHSSRFFLWNSAHFQSAFQSNKLTGLARVSTRT